MPSGGRATSRTRRSRLPVSALTPTVEAGSRINDDVNDDEGSVSDASSLTIPSRSPSPAWDVLPSPPRSQSSSRQTPCTDDTSVDSVASSVEDGEERPAKRRRITNNNMPRATRRLDLSNLQNLESQVDLDRLVKAIRTKRKVVVVAGAGISVSAGIPDFRSSTGLFNSLKAQHNLKGSGKQLFDADVYRDSESTSSFHQMVRQLSAETKIAKPTRFHQLLASLSHEGRLMRLYTQNVDGIDTSLPPLITQVPLAGKAPWPKTIQLHGGLSKMVCTKCSAIEDFNAELFDGPMPPECQICLQLDDLRENEGKRSRGIGKLRPRMVLYNEHNPDDEAIGSCVKADMRRRPDCIIVVGTTLKVPGIKRIVREMTGIVRDHRDGVSVWINNDPEPSGKEFENSWDIIVKGTSDEVAEHAGLRHWDEEEIGEVKVVSEEEVTQIKKQSELRVVVNSPVKPKLDSSGLLPTPVDSPRPMHTSSLGLNLVTTASREIVVKKLTLKLSDNSSTATVPPQAALENPASKGKSLNDVLSGPQPKASQPRVGGATAAKNAAVKTTTEASKPRGRPRKPAASSKRGAASTNSQANSRLQFQVTKANPALASTLGKAKDLEAAKKPEPLSMSPTRENILIPRPIELIKAEKS